MPRQPSSPELVRAQVAVGAKVRALRNERDLSQEELAHSVDMHRTFVGRVERGEVNPTLGTLMILAGGLGVSVADLVRDL